jgi:catechol 2,3-dioxygenase-like lactoylglutathione lyase family enzyme
MSGGLIRIQHVAMPFPGTDESVAAARGFYSGLLGLEELTVPEALAGSVLWLAVGDQELHLFAEQSAVGGNDQTRRHPCFEVAHLGAFRDGLEQSGVKTIDGNPAIAGRPRFFVIDPFGNALEFIQLTA